MLVCFILGVNFVHFTKFLPNFSSKKISFPFVIRKYSVEWYFETMNILFPNSLLHNSFNIFWWFLYESIITMGVIKWWFFCSVITWTDRFFFVSQFLLLFILMLNLTTIWPVGPPLNLTPVSPSVFQNFLTFWYNEIFQTYFVFPCPSLKSTISPSRHCSFYFPWTWIPESCVACRSDE